MAMTKASKAELSRDEQTEQTISAIRMLNRLSVVEIRLRRANRLSEDFRNEMKAITYNIHSFTDSLLLGEDVRSNLGIIGKQVTEFEQRISV
ncbi:MAG: hypothetical protein AB7F88_12315 [Pyrinomonadaceae bacterium]